MVVYETFKWYPFGGEIEFENAKEIVVVSHYMSFSPQNSSRACKDIKRKIYNGNNRNV